MQRDTGITASGIKWTFSGPDAMGTYFYFVHAADGKCLDSGNGVIREQQRQSMELAIMRNSEPDSPQLEGGREAENPLQ